MGDRWRLTLADGRVQDLTCDAVEVLDGGALRLRVRVNSYASATRILAPGAWLEVASNG